MSQGLATRCGDSEQVSTAVGTSYYVAPEVLKQKLGAGRQEPFVIDSQKVHG